VTGIKSPGNSTIRHSTFRAKAFRLEVIRVGWETGSLHKSTAKKHNGTACSIYPNQIKAVKPGLDLYSKSCFTFHSNLQLCGAWHNSFHILLGYSRNIHTSSLPHRKFGVILPPFGCLDAF
jgi:hypothetical protein